MSVGKLQKNCIKWDSIERLESMAYRVVPEIKPRLRGMKYIIRLIERVLNLDMKGKYNYE